VNFNDSGKFCENKSIFTSKSRSNTIKMSAKPLSERELVRICMTELCKQAGFADPGHMVQRDLQFLCETIESRTGVLISLSTIKRLLNGEFARMPQIATLDALARFLGYQSWQGFRSSQTLKTEALLPAGKKTNGPRTGKIKWVFWTPLLLLVLLGILANAIFGKHRSGDGEKAQFSAVKTTGNDLPNTVIFKYNIDSVAADSFFIQQSWDRNRRVRISKGSHTLTDIYYEPGYHVAKLIANDRIIKTVDVSLPTDRWFFYTKEKLFGGAPKYILTEKPFKNGSLQLSQDDLVNSKIDTQKENNYISVYFPSRIESSSDNFTLKFRIRVNVINNVFCPYFMGEVFCQRNFMFFKSTLKGCVSELAAQFGEDYLSGKTIDLSGLSSDVKAWQNVEVMVKDKRVTICMNNIQVFATRYSKSCGSITGLGFISNGLCEVDSVGLRTIDGKVVYSNNFDH
jgi:hypothetical protein